MNLKTADYLRKARHYWLIIGTIIVLFSWFSGFEASLTYLLATVIVWLIVVGSPIIIIKEIEKWFNKRL